MSEFGGKRRSTPAGRTPTWTADFVRMLGEGSTVKGACRALDIRTESVYSYRKRHPEFADAWDDAYEQGSDLLEEEAQRRGVRGVEEPVFYQGEVVGTVTRYSDALLITMLKARRPARFRENYHITQAPISALSSRELELARQAGRDPELEHAFDVLERALTKQATPLITIQAAPQDPHDPQDSTDSTQPGDSVEPHGSASSEE